MRTGFGSPEAPRRQPGMPVAMANSHQNNRGIIVGFAPSLPQ
jgi:hypothetical protein